MVTYNNDVYILPIESNPIIKNDIFSFQCSVLQSNTHGLDSVVFNYFLNLIMGEDGEMVCRHLHNDKWFLKSKIMHRNHMILSSDMYSSNTQELESMIISFISQGYYLYGTINAFYISAKSLYEVTDSYERYVIYGYDLSKKYFYAVGGTKSGVFEKHLIPFDEYYKGVFNCKTNMFNLSFIKCNDDYNQKLNCREIYNGIYDYINSKNKDSFLFKNPKSADYLYGIACYRYILDSVAVKHAQGGYIDLTSCAVLVEHHQIMNKRIEHLLSERAIKSTRIADDYNRINEIAKNTYSICLEYNASHNPQLIKKMHSNFKTIINEEQQTLNELLFELKAFIICN